jgi:anti-sigma factor RsiW
MNKCTESDVQEMLPDLLHGTLADEARVRVEAHLATCESCQEELDVLRTVKNAAVFAPSIDVNRVVGQIPPYRPIVPTVEAPTRTRLVSWLVAATLVIAVAGGGSLLIPRQNAAGTRANATRIAKAAQQAVNPTPVASKALEPVAPGINAQSAPSHTHALALAADVQNLSDGKLVQLMNDMDRFDALPNSESDPVISVDSGDSI